MISILLIIYTIIFIKTSLMSELTTNEFEDLKKKINETLIPWNSELRKHKNSEQESINSKIHSVIDNILSNSENLITNYGTKFTIIIKIKSFIENTKILINQIINYFSNNSTILDDIIKKWEICIKKITPHIKSDIKSDIMIKGENVGKWPLFIMLISSIACFGFSSSFHWFLIYSKNVYSILSRLDYAGITFLIPGSCFPPYFYFYYCEKC